MIINGFSAVPRLYLATGIKIKFVFLLHTNTPVRPSVFPVILPGPTAIITSPTPRFTRFDASETLKTPFRDAALES